MGNGLQQEDPLRLLLEQDAVVSTINRLFRATDEGDWHTLESCFAPEVTLDMTSLVGGEPEATTPAEISRNWKQALAHVGAVHHQAGNYEVQVQGTRAAARCNGTAYHYTPGATGQAVRHFVGTYDLVLDKRRGSWCVALFRYNVRFVDDSVELESVGAQT